MLCRLYWWRLRTQRIQEALAVAGIAAGVALIFAVEIANTSVPASVRDLVHGIAGPASLEVAARTPEGFNESLVSKVGEVPGVFGDSGILNARVTVVGPRGQRALTLFGAEAGISAIGGPLAHQFPRRALESGAPAGVQAFGLAGQLHSAHVGTVALPEGAARRASAKPKQNSSAPTTAPSSASPPAKKHHPHTHGSALPVSAAHYPQEQSPKTAAPTSRKPAAPCKHKA
jgi:hypothetical protein